MPITIVKLTRALMIVPICVIIAGIVIWSKKKAGGAGDSNFKVSRIFPWFILWFVVASIINTTGILAPSVSHFLGQAGKFFIIMAMVAIGFEH